jgi:hypothetical protein
MPDGRPRVTAYLDKSDEELAPFLMAIGRVILAVGGLEQMLLLEIARLLVERNSTEGAAPWTRELAEELSRLEGLTAGQRLRELRNLELSPDLDQRIGDVIEQRNHIVHHLVEDPQVVKAMSGDGQDEMVKRFEQLALDGVGLAAELHIVAAAKLEELIGHSQSELTGMLKTIDPETIEDPRERKQLEALQALGEVELPTWDVDAHSGSGPGT